MQIVIDIPKEMWEQVKDGYVPLGISKYLKSGTPLPKGHGRLGDLDKLAKDSAVIVDTDEESYSFVYLESIMDAPTIVEADKESEVEE